MGSVIGILVAENVFVGVINVFCLFSALSEVRVGLLGADRVVQWDRRTVHVELRVLP